jgi:pSer/pThr/pTyr-binding forkhead associated (FHA) protein
MAIRPLDDDDAPIVAWIVPVTGLAAYQTFRLADRTLIGAGADCDVRIADPHMSTHHAEIQLLNGDYVLIDRDSRNGITFYDKTISRHTLIDNDRFTCGTTSF